MLNVVQVVINDTSDKVITGIIEYDRANGGILIIPSGSSLPTSSVGGEVFFNTADNQIYRRDTANTTWTAVSGGSSGGGEPNASYLVLAATASLNNERVFTPGTGLSATDAGANGAYTLGINNAVVATVTGTIFTGPIGVGTRPALTGSIRLENSGAIRARNAANTDNIRVIGVDTSNNIVLGDEYSTAYNFSQAVFGQRVGLTPQLIATGTIASGSVLSVTSSLTTNKRYTYTAEVWAESTGSGDVVYAKGLLVKAHLSASTALVVVNKSLDDDFSSTNCTFVCTSSGGNVTFAFTNGVAAGVDAHVAVGWYEVNKP